MRPVSITSPGSKVALRENDPCRPRPLHVAAPLRRSIPDANRSVIYEFAMDTIRVVVVDDHPMFREGAVQSLACTGGIEVVGEGATAADALKVAEELQPDVLLLDISLPGGGVEAAAKIAQVCPNVRVIILTASERERDVASALRAGARGYILKGSSGAEVVETVRTVQRGECFVAPDLAARLLIEMGQRKEVFDHESAVDLTISEEKILAHVSSGMTLKSVSLKESCLAATGVSVVQFSRPTSLAAALMAGTRCSTSIFG